MVYKVYQVTEIQQYLVQTAWVTAPATRHTALHSLKSTFTLTKRAAASIISQTRGGKKKHEKLRLQRNMMKQKYVHSN